MKLLKINTQDKTIVSDKAHTYKKWFNGIKRFFTVKVLPPQK